MISNTEDYFVIYFFSSHDQVQGLFFLQYFEVYIGIILGSLFIFFGLKIHNESKSIIIIILKNNKKEVFWGDGRIYSI